MSARAGSSDGFSLIEALVALAVLAVATVGLVGAVEQHIDSTRAMESRATATWVAQNRLAELTLGGPAVGPEVVTMLGSNWRIEQRETMTADPEIARVIVRVFPEGGKGALATLDGFLDAGQRAAR